MVMMIKVKLESNK